MGQILRWNCPKKLKARVSACQQRFSLTRSRNTGGQRNGDHKTQTSNCVRMVHVRRGFYDLAKAKTPIAIELLQRIGALYEIEARVRGKTAAERRAVRQAELIETCKLNGVNPQAYFTDLLTRLVNGWPQNGIDQLMPWHWATKQPP